MDEIIVRIRAEGTEQFIRDVKKAGGVVEDVSDSVEDTNEKMSKSFIKVGKAIGAAFAVGAITNFIKESVRLADIQLKAEQQLLKALDGRERIQKRLIRQAQQLQSTTLFGDEELIAQQAFLANLGFTEKQIRKVIKAATDLSAGANISLESSVRNLAKTYSGLSGELGELVTPLRDLTQEQLKNGEAVELVSKLYEGQAQVLAETGTGPLVQAQNAFSDLREELGKAFIPVLGDLARALVNGIEKLRQWSNAVSGVKELLEFEEEVEALDELALSNQRFALEAEASALRQEKAATGLSILQTKRIKEINDRIAVIDDLVAARKLEADAEDDAGDGAEESAAQAKKLEDAIRSLFLASLKTAKVLGTDEGSLTDVLKQLQKEFTKTKTVADEFQESLIGDSGLQISESTQAAVDGYRAAADAATSARIEAEDANQRAIDAEERRIELQKERVDSSLDAIGNIGQANQAFFNAFVGFQQAELVALQNKYEQGLIGEKEFQRERAEILEKQARADKANAIFQTIINTAAGVAKAIPNLPLIALASAIGATQLATIAAQPIPQFAEGTKGSKRAPKGFAWVGEEGPELVQMKGGEKVITAHDSKELATMLAGYGIPVQFNSTADELYKPMTAMHHLVKNTPLEGIDWNPLLHSNEHNRRSAGRKLDAIYQELVRLNRGMSHRMTKA